MNWLPKIDYRISVIAGVVSVALFVWGWICHDLFGVWVGSISAITNFASAIFNYSIQPMLNKERRQHLIQLTLGE